MGAKKRPCIAVVGGGASGMMAAVAASAGGANVILIERNEKLGKKLYITGKGRCNLTNTAPLEEFMASIVRNPRFMYSSLDTLSNEALMRFFENSGLRLKVERGGRVFPASDKASDVIKALIGLLNKHGVDIRLNCRLKSIKPGGGGFTLETERGGIHADSAILATGGVTYPSTGSTGDGHAIAAGLGHDVLDLFPSLVDIRTEETWPGSLSGLTLKNVCLTANSKGKRVYHGQGELLFTHNGISGPLALTCSSYITGRGIDDIRLFIDMKPALDMDTLDRRIVRDFEKHSKKQLKQALFDLMPKSMAPVVISLCGLSCDSPVNSVTREQRKSLAALIKAMPLSVDSLGGMDGAIITRGGVSVKDVNPKTMESKRAPGLYICGELLDVDACTGGYNLQIAFSTGYTAGKNAALRIY